MIGNRLFERFGIIFQEKPPSVGVRSHEQASQDAGVVTLQEPNVQVVGQLSITDGA
jgi:putative transposase